MMNLVLDLGNTALKWAIYDGKNLIVKGKFSYVEWSNKHIEWMEFDIQHVAIAAVIDLPNEIENYLKRFNSVLIVDANTRLPIKNSYKTPETLGVDRLVNAVGAISMTTNNEVLVIDCGTCLKLDLVTRSNGFIGGAISPGVNMRYASLEHFTSKLPHLHPSQYGGLTGTSTSESIHNGVMNGMINEILGTIENYQNSFPNIHIIITGGDMDYFQKITEKKPIFAEPDLTLVGINLILLHNL
jgi:type III pantothenate kinase